jgi:hypothetical protein
MLSGSTCFITRLGDCVRFVTGIRLPRVHPMRYRMNLSKATRALAAVFVSISIAVVSEAQTLSPSVIASGGSFRTAGGYSISYTMGEAVVATADNGSHFLTQGFQQPNDLSTGIAG